MSPEDLKLLQVFSFRVWCVLFICLLIDLVLFVAVLGLHCCTGFSLVVASGGCSLVVAHRVLIAVASVVGEHRLWAAWASVVVVQAPEHWLRSCGIWTELLRGNGTPLQYSCLENPMDGGAWWAAVHGVAKSQTRLHFHFSLPCIGEGNGNPLQCSCLENPRDGEPGGLPSQGSHRVGHD